MNTNIEWTGYVGYYATSINCTPCYSYQQGSDLYLTTDNSGKIRVTEYDDKNY